MKNYYKDLIERAADALIEWENANDFGDVAKWYRVAYDTTCKAIALQVRDKEKTFRDITRKVLEKRSI